MKTKEKKSFLIKDDDVLDKYNEIWNKIKKTLNTKFHSMPVYDKKYIKAKGDEHGRSLHSVCGAFSLRMRSSHAYFS